MLRRLKDLLLLAGLKEEEIQTYLLLLKLRKATATELLQRNHASTMTEYRTLHSLVERGLVRAKKVDQKTSVYSPLSLKALVRHIDQEQRKLRHLEKALSGLDPLLPYLDIESKEDDPVELREGIEAFRHEFLLIPFLCDSVYLRLGSIANLWKTSGYGDESPEVLSFRAQRYKRRTFLRAVDNDTPQAQAMRRRDAEEMRCVRIDDRLPMQESYIAITERQVMHFICVPEHPRVVVLRHPELVAYHHEVFQRLWDSGSEESSQDHGKKLLHLFAENMESPPEK